MPLWTIFTLEYFSILLEDSAINESLSMQSVIKKVGTLAACITKSRHSMRNRLLRYTLLSLVLVLTASLIPLNAAIGDSLNLATKAKITTSFVSGWEKLAALNDGVASTASNVKPSAGAYGNWNGEGDYGIYNWVQYEWDNAHLILSTSVYWWIDNTAVPAAGISKPTAAYVQYWDGIDWVLFDSIGLALNTYNKLTMGVVTKKIRLNMRSGAATGIIEWKADGVEYGPCEPTPVTSYYRVNGGDSINSPYVNLEMGDSLLLGMDGPADGKYGWTGPGGFKATGKTIVLKGLTNVNSGSYTGSYVNACGSASTCLLHLTIRDTSLTTGQAYAWPKYNPTLNYNFKDEFPALKEPTKILDDDPNVVGTIASGWWAFRWGPSANSLIDSASVMPMLARLNKDFAYFRDSLGWPPDKRAKNGYKSTVYLYGSGLNTDDASNTDLGGWQSSIFYNGQSWPMVLISYYPVYSFNPKCTYGDRVGQMGAVTHEGIHAVLADLPGCKNAAWFHEGGNTWLQQEAEVRQSKNYGGMGFLNAGSFIAPFMPIECYSGWLQDGSFGGPSAEGVNKFEGSQQICTWRNLLGGVQYSNVFPVFLGMTLGHGSIAWIWRNCESRVLEGMAKTLGETQIRRLIAEYRAKQAVLDMGPWTNNMKQLMNSNMGLSIKSEWSPYDVNVPVWSATPYVVTSMGINKVLTPEARTLPGWSGANQIPLVVSGNEVVVNFMPLSRNMTCQLCYRTKQGVIRYSQVVNGGECRLALDVPPANGVVFAVIANTDYIYEGEVTRTTKHDYRLQLVKGATSAAAVTKKWFDWTLTLVDLDPVKTSEGTDFTLFPNPMVKGQTLNIDLGGAQSKALRLSVTDVSGRLVYSDLVKDNTLLDSKPFQQAGLYLVTLEGEGYRSVRKLIVE